MNMNLVNTENSIFKKIKKKKRIMKNKNITKNNFKYKISIAINIILSISLFIILLKNILFKKIYFKTLDMNNNNKIIIFEKINLLKMMTNNDENEYKGIKNCLENDPDKLECIYHLMNTKEVIGKKRILLGEKSDGCYVLLDDFQNIKIAYSFGISTNIQFDEELAKRRIDVYMYDHTINSLPFQNDKFHWKKIGICGKNTNNAQLKTLEDLIAENGHTSEKNMILKMDVEFYEWEAILDLKEETLKQFKYIAIEFHFNFRYINPSIYYQVLKKIYKTHQAFYIRCNGDRAHKINFGNNRICHIIEVSYIIREDNIFKKDETIYPMYEFDYSQIVPGKLDMNLNLLKLFD